MTRYSFDDLLQTVDALLGENGCPWDRKQTFLSLREDLLEECYEAVEAVDNKDDAALREELGDILLSVALYAKIAEKNGLFDINGVVNGITEKIIRRHSHVFGAVTAETPEESLKNWEAEKNREKGFTTATEKIKSVPRALPALMRAQKVLKRAVAAGYAAGIEKEANGAVYRANKNGAYGDDRALMPGEGEASGVNRSAGAARAKIIEKFINMSASLKNTEGLGAPELTKLVGGLLFQLIEVSTVFEINAELALTNGIEEFINVVENAENAGLLTFLP